MARLTKEQMGDRGRYRFKQEEVEIPELQGDDDEVPTVLVRTPSVGQKDALGKRLPDDEKDWDLGHVSLLFSAIVVEPSLSEAEAKEFLNDWPSDALDRILAKWVELQGTQEEMRQQAGDFRGSNE